MKSANLYIKLFSKFLPLLAIICLFYNGFAQETLTIKKEELPISNLKNWIYINKDVPGFQAIDFKDSFWKSTKTNLPHSVQYPTPFDGIACFRLKFKVDKSLVELPLAFGVIQQGASEIYLDGKLLKLYGVIKDSAQTVNFNPQNKPLVFVLRDTGIHVLAIRYANFGHQISFEKFRVNNGGFHIEVGQAANLIESYHSRDVFISSAMSVLSSIFFTLCLLHLFMFLYNLKTRSNLYFSVLMLMLGVAFCFGLVSFIGTNPSTINQIGYFNIVIICFASMSLAGFIQNLLLNKLSKIFWLWTLITLIAFTLKFSGSSLSNIISFVLVVGVLIEASTRIIRAIYQKIQGIWIIGTGILFFTFAIFTAVISLIIEGGDIGINGGTTLGMIVIIMIFLAILSIPFSTSVYLAWNFSKINRDLEIQLREVNTLSAKMLEQEQEKKRMLESRKEELESEVSLRTAEVVKQKQEIEQQNIELSIEKKKSDDLLLNILPEEIADELKLNGEIKAKQFEEVSVLFTDFVNFTGVSSRLSPKELVSQIHEYFVAFDAIMEKNQLEKIKTIGDAYLAVCGLPQITENHAIKTVQAAIEINKFVQNKLKEGGLFDIRIGINTGSVVAGIVGVKKFAYDIWGDTVNTAARMEQNSEAGKINISGSTYLKIKDHFTCTHRGMINAKNKGEIDMYFVEWENE